MATSHASPVAHNPAASAVDPEVIAIAKALHAALNSVAPEKRRAVADMLIEMLEPLQRRQRGGEVLNNVIQLFKEQRRKEWSASQVVAALKERGQDCERKAVFNALTYLTHGPDPSRRILRKFGYGKYLMADGSVADNAP
jgi:hypothetical protein